MHYADGQPAKTGDLVIHDDFGAQVAGILTGANAQSDTCNGNIHAIAKRAKSALGLGNWIPIVGANDNYYVTLSKCVAVDFAEISATPSRAWNTPATGCSGAIATQTPAPASTAGTSPEQS